jgi:UDP-GlcNAc:undecaprenyl-phosphate/decaprenyl-phosphate GlcNAc-1-phosphate transferase
MMDLPDPRKVHARPVARVGGIGVVIGSLASIYLWLPVDNTIGAYLFGSIVLLLFGAWDDCRELGHYVKFVGQFIAVVAIVYWGDVWVSSLPLVGEELPRYVGKPFTVVAIVGMINAINHSDGLDGLAGGESLLSLGCIAYLAHLADGFALTGMAVAIIGGLTGFLRYNTYPARIFMGDSGSQFLGFSLGVLAVLLTQRVDRSISMALPALILGLPIIDILAVLAQRVYHRMNWFRATKNHIHHRLLGLQFDHYQAVLIIYSIQALFVVSAIFLRYESDSLLLSLYLGVCALIFALLLIAERAQWKAGNHVAESGLTTIVRRAKANRLFADGPTLFVKASVPLYFFLGSLWVQGVTADFGVVAIAFVGILSLALILHWLPLSRYLLRLVSYGTAAFLAYLIQKYAVQGDSLLGRIEIGYFTALGIAIALAVRYGRDTQFRTTPMDYLLVFVVVASAFLQRETIQDSSAGALVIKVFILFYGSELILNARERRWNGLLDISVLASSGILALKAFV